MPHDHTATTLEASLATIGSKATTAGATTSVVSWVLSSEFGFLIGVLVAIGGFIVNWYYKAKEDSRREREHEARMRERQ